MPFTLRGDDVCQPTPPTPISNPYWVAFSASAAKLINLELEAIGLPKDPDWLELLAGNQLNAGALTFSSPISTAYSGHQFGSWAGQLGDGRAILLGDINELELQLKGAGKTHYSRMGDGRAVLRSSIREFLCSEAMYALGIPTSRALSVVGSKQRVIRETVETAAVCSRIAPSFIRVGHFEHFASLQNTARLKELADLLMSEFYQECLNAKDPYLSLFKEISARNAKLVAQWQSVGFCHGVLNSDNISALGLTIDYGPFGFLDHFEIDHICNHSDHGGRYAYHRQPQIMHWNMACLASAMLPLLGLEHSPEESQALLRSALEEFPVIYAKEWQKIFRSKLGFQLEQDSDIELIERLLQAMNDSKIDFTTFFRQLSNIRKDSQSTDTVQRNEFIDRDSIDQWFSDYIHRLQVEVFSDEARKGMMDQVNPKYILRNHLAQAAIEKAQQDDFSEIERLQLILSKPFDEQESFEGYAKPPPIDMQRIEVSCSS
ncbi:YdiU family protein [Polynucleobacter sp. AP-Elch-400A-B2]|uniref:protein adenylyltransferase SelO n=1 Tax=Polynucleobacter sp. AP-Elch-400A-B2 TaxID=2576930 RepID=UPI001BFD0689|nr:YdiU family protein [Polynucleobacter sp. AP-Elch-400A-B2]QWE23765.1 YdiU family protein [Polynucleobacter sp. AP-Elch-400A-B2]